MISLAFSLFDSKTGFFHVPFFMPHAGHAIRAVMDLGQDLSTSVGRHPADYILYAVGSFDDQTGTFHVKHPEAIGSVLSFLPNKAPPLFPGVSRETPAPAIGAPATVSRETLQSSEA